jgi:hypothetical protein
MVLSKDERKLFQAAYHRVIEYGSGDFHADMPKAIKGLAVKLNRSRTTSGQDRLLMGAIARRMDQIAMEISKDGDFATVMISIKMRNLRDQLREEAK